MMTPRKYHSSFILFLEEFVLTLIYSNLTTALSHFLFQLIPLNSVHWVDIMIA